MSFRVLHIGDLHFWRFPLNPFDYVGKRLLGVGNLALRRAKAFSIDRAPLMVSHALSLKPDLVAFSGDFTTTALDSEFEAARSALLPLFRDTAHLAVPGNHDRYTPTSTTTQRFEKHFGERLGTGSWPFFHELSNGVWIVGMDATTRNGLDSFGMITPTMEKSLENWFSEHGKKVKELWLLCHFPAEDPPQVLPKDRGDQLRNAGPLLRWIKELKIPVLFLHGHHHYRWLYGSPTAPNLTYINAGAPFLRRSGLDPDLGFLELEHKWGRTRVRLHTCRVIAQEWGSAVAKMPKMGQFVNLQCPCGDLPAEVPDVLPELEMESPVP